MGLANLEQPVNDSTLLLALHHGVNEPLHDMASILKTKTPLPSFLEAQSLLALEESELPRYTLAVAFIVPRGALVIQVNFPKGTCPHNVDHRIHTEIHAKYERDNFLLSLSYGPYCEGIVLSYVLSLGPRQGQGKGPHHLACSPRSGSF
jgi:hypothetical protein